MLRVISSMRLTLAETYAQDSTLAVVSLQSCLKAVERGGTYLCTIIQEVAILICDLLRQLLLLYAGQQPSFLQLQVRSCQTPHDLLVNGGQELQRRAAAFRPATSSSDPERIFHQTGTLPPLQAASHGSQG